MQENYIYPLSPVVTPVERRRKRRRRSSFRYCSRRQLSKARMNRRFPRVTGVDLSGTTKNLSYNGNMSYKAIREDLVEDEGICEA